MGVNGVILNENSLRDTLSLSLPPLLPPRGTDSSPINSLVTRNFVTRVV